MKENKQINQELQQEATEQNEAPVIDKDSVDILDLLETASSWLVSPEDKEVEKKFNEIKNQIVVKSFLPLYPLEKQATMKLFQVGLIYRPSLYR